MQTNLQRCIRMLSPKNKIYRTNKHQLMSSKEMSNEEMKDLEILAMKENASFDNPPTTCCRSGCANCVYIAWAEALSKKVSSQGPEFAQKILEHVQDPSMRAFLEFELRMKGLVNQDMDTSSRNNF